MSNADIGVVVGRFQVGHLHKGHTFLLDEVAEKHEKLIVLLGCSHAPPNQKDPLDFITRHHLITMNYPQAVVLPVYDEPCDKLWSEKVDILIRQVFPQGKALLFGGRKSCLTKYSGKWPTLLLESNLEASGTENRAAIFKNPDKSVLFREGMIYAQGQRYPIAYHTVDIAILDKSRRVLLAQKPNDPINKWRFIGGFVGPQDQTAEMAALREAKEEAGDLELSPMEYLGSSKIDDWRYTAEDGILTSFFKCKKLFGREEARDDISKIQWFDLNQSLPVIDTHLPLKELLLND